MEPDVDLMLDVAAGRRSRDALTRACVRGARAACPDCRRGLEELARVLERHGAGRRESWPRVWLMARLGAIDPRAVCPAAYREAEANRRRLERLAPGERLRAVTRAQVRYRSAAQAEVLLEAAREAVGRDPAEAREWAAAAEEVAFWLPAAGYPEGVVAELALRAKAHRADALRAAGELEAAEALFADIARDRRRPEVASMEVEAEMVRFEAALRERQRRYPEAMALWRRAARLTGGSCGMGDMGGVGDAGGGAAES